MFFLSVSQAWLYASEYGYVRVYLYYSCLGDFGVFTQSQKLENCSILKWKPSWILGWSIRRGVGISTPHVLKWWKENCDSMNAWFLLFATWTDILPECMGKLQCQPFLLISIFSEMWVHVCESVYTAYVCLLAHSVLSKDICTIPSVGCLIEFILRCDSDSNNGIAPLKSWSWNR